MNGFPTVNNFLETRSEVLVSDPGERWCSKEVETLTQLAQTDLAWVKIAEQLPGRSITACQKQWLKIKPSIPLIDKQKRCKISKYWSPEEIETLTQLAQARLAWEKIAEHFPGASIDQCRRQWQKIKPNAPLSHKRKRDEGSVDSERASKIARTLNSFDFSRCASAVNLFKRIDLDHPTLLSHQYEASLFLRGVQATYKELKQKAHSQEDCSQLMEEMTFAVQAFKERIALYEMLYQHFSRFQTEPAAKEQLMAQNEVFSTLYVHLLSGVIDESHFKSEMELKERDYRHQKITKAFHQRWNKLDGFSDFFGRSYQMALKTLSLMAQRRLVLLEDDQQKPEWEEALHSLEAMIGRMQEVEGCIFGYVENHVDGHKVETSLVARLKSEMSAQDFHREFFKKLA